MTARESICPVLSNDSVYPGLYRIVLGWSPTHAPSPGQFILIKPYDCHDPLLPRPFTIYKMYKDAVEILYKVVGKGTQLLSSLREGQRVRVIGPLGQGFRILPDTRHAILVAGGIGIASICRLCTTMQGLEVSLFYGARTKDSLVGIEELQRIPGLVMHLSTDDGSIGFKGTVMQLLRSHLKVLRPGASCIYACGPLAMLKQVSSYAQKKGISCQVSLESNMACGVGACLGCAVTCKQKGNKKDWEYKLCCKDGPVFDTRDLIW